MMRRTNGFTLIELLVVVGIISLLVMISVPSLLRARVLTKRAVCATDLSNAVKGLHMYATQNENRFPSVGYGRETERFDLLGAYIETACQDNNGQPDKLDDSNSRNLFLAVRLEFVEPDVLTCVATTDQPADRKSGGNDTYYDFNVGNGSDYQGKCSYSYHLQFSTRAPEGGEVVRGYPLRMTCDASMAVLADKNPFVTYPGSSKDTGCYGNVDIPSGTDPSSVNSPNHDREGQNVAYLDSHVSWKTVPTVGSGGDNIYTAWKSTGSDWDRAGGELDNDSMPRGKEDSVLAP